MKKRLRQIKEAEPAKFQSFWCDRCGVDYEAVGHKCPIPSSVPDFVYRSRHKCGKVNVRRITEIKLDKYFVKSRKVWADRNRYAVDTLQPGTAGYNTYGGK